jgi:hypothetical protein
MVAPPNLAGTNEAENNPGKNEIRPRTIGPRDDDRAVISMI